MRTTTKSLTVSTVMLLLGSNVFAGVSSLDELFTRITTGKVVNDGGLSFGVAVDDYDDDGWPDLFVTNGVNDSDVANFLYRNNGDGIFTRVNTGPVAADKGKSIAAAWGDYNNDGFPDLVVANWPNEKLSLYQNNGDGTFLKVTATLITTDDGQVRTCAWGDYDRDGWLDLFVAPVSGASRLYHNKKDGTFERVDLPEIAEANSAAWADYDNDGFPDLFICTANQGNVLFHNQGDGTFKQITDSPVTQSGSSFSAVWGDYDNDGFLDLFVANGFFADVRFTSFLYHNNGDGTFTEVTSGPIATDGDSAIGAAWADVDNDGYLDLYVAHQAGQKNFFYHNNGDGTFTKIVQGKPVTLAGNSNGALFADFNHDGFLDLFVANWNQNNWLFQNNGNSNGWLVVKCIGTKSNRSAIGAKVRVKAIIGGKAFWQVREISSGSGISGSSPLAYFGLGDATEVDTLRIEWPSGAVRELKHVPLKQFLTISESPKLEPQMRLDGGTIELNINGWDGVGFGVEVSTDLLHWVLLNTVTNTTGSLRCPDPGAGHFSSRFYRIISP